MKYCGMSDIGLKRAENEDSFLVGKVFDGCVLAVVCDGMGGALGGKTASSMACDIFYSSVSDAVRSYINSELDISVESRNTIYKILISSAEKANEAVYSRSVSDETLTGMGTTLTAALTVGRYVYIINVGDSRTYKLSDSLLQITSDHSFVEALVEAGKITREEAKVHPQKNVITRAIGIDKSVVPDTFYTVLKKGESLLLCSDGLCGYVEHEDILGALSENTDINEKASELIRLAIAAGGKDNITAVLLTY